MKNQIIALVISFLSITGYAQVGINNTSPKASLDITVSNPATPANTDGILIPRVDAFPVTNPGADQQGMMVYLTTTSGSNPPGFYYWDNTTTSWLALNSADADWYKFGTTSVPNAISDNIFTEGNVFVNNGNLGVNTGDVNVNTGKMTITSPSDISGGIKVSKTVDVNNIYTYKNIDSDITTSSTSTNILGINSSFFGTGSNTQTAFYANLAGTGASDQRGFATSFGNDNSNTKTGLYNYFNSTSTGTKYGLRNAIPNPISSPIYGTFYGIHNDISAASSNQLYGAYTRLGGGSGSLYGYYASLYSGTGIRYGFYANLTGTGGGPDYGVRTSVEDVANGYAAYFTGRTSLGNTTTNRYLMPAADGTANQVMTTDGAGQLSFVDPTTLGTDDQTIDTFSFNAGTNVLTLEVENDGVVAQTVDLSSLQDADWFAEGTTAAPSAITDDIFTQGNVAIGKNTADYALDIDETRSTTRAVNISKTDNTSVLTYGINLIKNSSGSGQSRGIHIDLSGSSSGIITGLNNNINTTGNGEKIGVNNFLPNSGTADGNRIGIKNTFPVSPTGISQYGMLNTYAASAQGLLYGVYNDFNTLNTYTNTQYGMYNRFRNSSNNTKYGSFSIFEEFAGGDIRGHYVEMNSTGNTGERKAYEAVFGANTTGTIYGLDVDMNTTGNQTKYGVRVNLTPATGTSNYGIHSTVQSANGFAGYFVGNSYFSNRVGINTSSPNYRLSVAGVTNLNEGIASGPALRVNGAEALWYNGTYFSWGFGGTANYFADNVGIGTSTPDSKLAVAGIISAASDASEVNKVELGHGGANGYINNVGAGRLDFRHEGSNYMTLTDTGRLGIGTTTPSASLEVKRNSTGTLAQLELEEAQANDGARIKFTNTSETNNNWVLFGRADNTNTDSRFNIYNSATGNIVVATGDGKVGILRTPTTNPFEVNGQASKSTAGSWIANSDRRLKKEILSISGKEALNKINKMRGVTYLWNDDKTGIKRPTDIQYGFIAQELKEVFPSKVSKDKLGYYQTAYGDYDPIFVEAIKELNKQVKNLSEKNQNQEKEIARLKKELSKFESLEAKINSLQEKVNGLNVNPDFSAKN